MYLKNKNGHIVSKKKTAKSNNPAKILNSNKNTIKLSVKSKHPLLSTTLTNSSPPSLQSFKPPVKNKLMK